VCAASDIKVGWRFLARNVLTVIAEILAEDATSFHATAEALNARGVRTARGGAWQASLARNVTLRGDAPPPPPWNAYRLPGQH
jgi:hypothetical protein